MQPTYKTRREPCHVGLELRWETNKRSGRRDLLGMMLSAESKMRMSVRRNGFKEIFASPNPLELEATTNERSFSPGVSIIASVSHAPNGPFS